MSNPSSPASLEARLLAVEDRLAIYNLLASHPLSADTGIGAFFPQIYTEDTVFDRGALHGAKGRSKLVDLVESDAHREAMAGGIAHFGNLPLVDVQGDKATAVSYIMIVTPDHDADERPLANHGTSQGFRIFRLVANRWELVRSPDGWRISRRTILPHDGSGPAREMLMSVVNERVQALQA